VTDVKSCKEVCGKKCSKKCESQHTQCTRGNLSDNFIYCQFSNADAGLLPYTTYEIVEETNVKEGKKTYKR
jgi:hypothetical protein